MEKLLHKPVFGNNVVIPRDTLNQMLDAFEKMESVMSTIEILADKETMKSIEESKEDIKHGRFVECSLDDLEKVLAE